MSTRAVTWVTLTGDSNALDGDRRVIVDELTFVGDILSGFEIFLTGANMPGKIKTHMNLVSLTLKHIKA